MRPLAIRLSIILIAAFLAADVSAGDRPAAPTLTKEFVAQCKSNIDVCGEWISLSNVTYMLKSIRSNTAAGSCVPKAAYDNKGFSTESVNKIAAWLASQPGRADAPTQASLEAAFAAVWPVTQACRDESSDDLPTITGAFAAYCQHEDKRHKSTCDDVITTESVVAMMQNPAAICVPDSALASDAAFEKQIGDVKSWLTTHSEVHTRPRGAGIASAYAALYPCGAK